ncbi:MAG: glycine dehydrogenase, partial [Cycloclasticus sp.]
TNQGLLVTAATIYMSLMGPEGLKKVAIDSHKKTQALIKRLSSIEGVSVVFQGATFHECVLKIATDTKRLIEEMAKNHHILAGFDLSTDYPELGNAILVCATETRTDEDIERFAVTLDNVLNN